MSFKQGCFVAGVAISVLAANGWAFAADAPARPPPYTEAPSTKSPYPKSPYSKSPLDGSSHDWTGCYVGLNGGGGTMADSFTTSAFNGSVNGAGGIAGGQVGCNTQIGQLVFGIEGEGIWGDLVDRASLRQPFFSVQIATRNSWNADLAARAGVAIDRTLIYIKFGIASGGFDFSATNTNPLVDNGSGTLVGPLLGGGIEVAFAPHWSAKLEYDHIGYVGRSLQFSGSDFGVNMPINQSQSADVNLVKAGVNYQFGGSSAVAAGRPAPLPLFTKAAPASLTRDWTGCYVGVHSGGGTRIDSFNDINGDGGLAGGQLGCNTQIGQLVFGIEGESAWTNLVDRAQFTLAGSSQQSTTRNSWSADLAARAGVAFDRALIYTRIGVASGGFDFSFSATPQTENGRGALVGLLLGGGIEVAVAPHWSARLEYDHIDYVGRNLQFSQLSAGVNNSFDQSQSASVNLVKAGVNYQFGGRNVPAYASHPVMPAATFNWTGCHAGIHGGGGTQVDSFVAIIGGGGVAGGQLGCNTQIGQLVFGVESEGARTDLVDRASTALSGFSRHSITRNSWIADLSARAGVAIDRALIYSKIGMASGGFHFSTSATQPPIENGSGTLSGLLLGCGIEVAVAPHWSARLEYDHIDYVGRNFQFSEPALGSNLPFIAQSESASANLVKASVNYRFGGVNPVSAKF